MAKIDGAERRRQKNNPQSVEVGYIAIPPDVEREDFIDTCFRRGRVTVITEYGSVLNECYIDDDVLQRIEFPQEIEEKGSLVYMLSGSFNTKPIVAGILIKNDESPLLREKQYRLRKEMNGTEVLFQMDPESKALSIGLTSKEATEINLTVRGNEESKIKLGASGNVEIKTDEVLHSISYKEIVTEVIDVTNKDHKYKLELTKDGFVLSRENDDATTILTFDDEGISLSTKNGSDNTNTIIINDDGVKVADSNDNDVILASTGITISDNNNNQIVMKSGQIDITATKINLGNGAQPIPLGTTLTNLVAQICTACAAITVTAPPTGGVTSVPINAGQFSTIAGQLSTALSQKSFTD